MIEALKARLMVENAKLSKAIKDMPETALIETVSAHYGVKPGVNPSDWARSINEVMDGKDSRDSAGAIEPDGETARDAD